MNATDENANRMLSEWKRGMLTFWVMGLLSLRSMYGLEIRKEIETSTRDMMKLGSSTIYQLLRRLERRDLVESRWERTDQGPPRAYYQLTPAGVQVVRGYIVDVLLPGSPIAAALGVLTEQIIRQSGILSGES